MKRLTMHTLLLAAGMGMTMTALAAATLVRDVRVFDGERMHAKRSVLIDGAKIVNANFKGAAGYIISKICGYTAKNKSKRVSFC